VKMITGTTALLIVNIQGIMNLVQIRVVTMANLTTGAGLQIVGIIALLKWMLTTPTVTMEVSVLEYAMESVLC